MFYYCCWCMMAAVAVAQQDFAAEVKALEQAYLQRNAEAERRERTRQQLLRSGKYLKIARNSDNRAENCKTLCHCDIGALDYKFPSNKPRDVWVRGTYCSSVFSDYQGQERLCVGIDRNDLDYNGRPHETYGHWTAIRSEAHSNHGFVDCR